MIKQEVDISIIIPVYNVEAYLRECLDSVIVQECVNFEVLCVNDGSTDNSLSILDEYEKKYSFIHVYTKNNGGLSSARNYGIRKASGKYIFFLDSDDMLADEHCLSFMVESMDSNSLDAMYFDGKSFFEDEAIHQTNISYETAYQRKKCYGYYQNGRDLFIDFVRNGDYYVSSSLQCLRREFLNEKQLFYIEGIVYEDNIFTFKGMMLANRVMHRNRVVLLRRIRTGSIMQSKLKFRNFYSLFISYLEIVQFCRYSMEGIYGDKEISLVLNSLRNFAMSIYRKLEKGEKDKILKQPEYQQVLINAIFVPNVKVIGDAHFFPYHLFHQGNRIVIYGAGNIGKKFYYHAIKDGIIDVVGIVDSRALEMEVNDIPVHPVPMIKQMDYDYILIAVENSGVVQEIVENLMGIGVDPNKIKWDGEVYFKDNYHRKSYEYRKFSNRLMKSDRKRFFLFMLPEHGNLGDYAIGIAEKKFFDKYFPEYELVCVTTNEWKELRAYFVENIKERDVLFISGGGYLGDMWRSGSIIKEIISAFPQNIKIMLPNTLTYIGNNEENMKLDARYYTNHKKLYIFAREQGSYEKIVKHHYCEKNQIGIFPDMALSLNYSNLSDNDRNGVLLCFRNDVEKVYSDESVQKIRNILKEMSIDYNVVDVHLHRYVNWNDAEMVVQKKLDEFKHAKLVITDRLHGMIFAAITGTPCIAVDNSTGKVSGVYKWIAYLPYIQFIVDNQITSEKISEMLRLKQCFYNNVDILNRMRQMAEKIREFIDEVL